MLLHKELSHIRTGHINMGSSYAQRWGKNLKVARGVGAWSGGGAYTRDAGHD